jgi:hypothetical protein
MCHHKECASFFLINITRENGEVETECTWPILGVHHLPLAPVWEDEPAPLAWNPALTLAKWPPCPRRLAGTGLELTQLLQPPLHKHWRFTPTAHLASRQGFWSQGYSRLILKISTSPSQLCPISAATHRTQRQIGIKGRCLAALGKKGGLEGWGAVRILIYQLPFPAFSSWISHLSVLWQNSKWLPISVECFYLRKINSFYALNSSCGPGVSYH